MMQERMQAALGLLRAGDPQEGIVLLQACVAESPEDIEPRGPLAWALLCCGRLGEARDQYLEIQRRDPEDPEIDYRLLQIEWLSSGESAGLIRRLWMVAKKCWDIEEVWEHLSALAQTHSPPAQRLEIQQEAVRLFPHHTVFNVRLSQARAAFVCERRHRLFERLGVNRLARLALRSSAIRTLLVEQAAADNRIISVDLLSWYDKGSSRMSFPQAPERMRPGNFGTYLEGPLPVWWKWFAEHLPEPDPRGKRLLDIGAGSGLIGHHFLSLGYAVTALSGSEAELEECRHRGMATLQAEMHTLPVPARTFDAVLTSHVLEHSIVPFAMLREIWRVLKDDGFLYVNLPYPIEGNPALVHPDCYDEASDQCRFEVDPVTSTVKDLALAYYSYGVEHHVFVLTYWQWRWLFRQTGFKHLHSTLEVCGEERLVQPGELDAEPALRQVAKNQLFILQKARVTL